MSHYDQTIDVESFQSGRGGTGTNTWEQLDRIIRKECHKGVILRNNRLAGGNQLGVTLQKFTGDEAENSFVVPPGEAVFLPLRDPTQVRVAGVGGGVDYSYVAY